MFLHVALLVYVFNIVILPGMILRLFWFGLFNIQFVTWLAILHNLPGNNNTFLLLFWTYVVSMMNPFYIIFSCITSDHLRGDLWTGPIVSGLLQ